MGTTTLDQLRSVDNALLRLAMTENAVFSGVSGVLLSAGSPWLDGWLGAPAWLLVLVGVGLVGWAFELRRSAGTVLGGRLAVAGDAAWVLGTAVLLIGWPDALSASGRIAAEGVAVVVAAFAVAQAIGLRRLPRA